MQKIMFNDKYGLNDAALEGRKTQTRRMENFAFYSLSEKKDLEVENVFFEDGTWYIRLKDVTHLMPKKFLPKYQVGEIVAISQSYKSLGYQPTDKTPINKGGKVDFIEFQNHKGWNNKMFVSCDKMFHFIRITNIRAERLQDISDEDCLAEGITKIVSEDGTLRYYVKNGIGETLYGAYTPQKAYAFLIDKVGKKGDWESNPWVWVYDFELVK